MAQPHVAAHHAPLADTPPVRAITTADLKDALARGYADFLAIPTHLILIGLIYPILGVFLAGFAFGYDLLPLLFPLVSGFALIGPLAGVGLYEMSRRREAGLEPTWRDAFDVTRSAHIGSLLGMGLVLVGIFVLWLLSANAIYRATVGSIPTASYTEFFRTILTTSQGWALIVIGNVVGFAFAVLVLTISVIAFPLILDRGAGVGTAMAASRRAVLSNPVTMATWGLIVAALVALGSLPLFVGLAIVVPVLGHATWHLYRKVVA